MATLTITTFLTLDGVMQGPGGPTEDPRNGFTHGGWSFPYVDDEFGKFISDVFMKAGAFLLGRYTYKLFADYWTKITDPNDPVAGPLNRLPKYVASRTLDKAEWAGSTIIRDAAGEVPKLKSRYDGEIQVHGSADLAQTLIREDLIDRYNLLIYPVVLGTGKRLFGEGAVPRALRLIDSKTTGSGIAIHVYEKAGMPKYGSF